MMETNWRVRRATLEMITELAQGFKAVELYEVYLQEFFFKYFTDSVHAVRQYGNQQLHKILEIESSNWVNDTLIPKLEQTLIKEKTYLKRATAAYALEVIVQHTSGSVRQKVVGIICGMAKDSVANIRLIIAKIAKNIYPSVDSEEKQMIKTAIAGMVGDSDKDVKDNAKSFVDEFGN